MKILGDFGARKYDASIGRFTAIDPLFEMYPSYSPYNYCNNNPINYIDPSGFAILADQEAIKQGEQVNKEENRKHGQCPNLGWGGIHNCDDEVGGGFPGSGGGGFSDKDEHRMSNNNSMPHEQQGGVKPNSSGSNATPGNTNETNASQTASTPTPNGASNGFIPLQSWADQMRQKVTVTGGTPKEQKLVWDAIDNLGEEYFSEFLAVPDARVNINLLPTRMEVDAKYKELKPSVSSECGVKTEPDPNNIKSAFTIPRSSKNPVSQIYLAIESFNDPDTFFGEYYDYGSGRWDYNLFTPEDIVGHEFGHVMDKISFPEVYSTWPCFDSAGRNLKEQQFVLKEKMVEVRMNTWRRSKGRKENIRYK